MSSADPFAASFESYSLDPTLEAILADSSGNDEVIASSSVDRDPSQIVMDAEALLNMDGSQPGSEVGVMGLKIKYSRGNGCLTAHDLFPFCGNSDTINEIFPLNGLYHIIFWGQLRSAILTSKRVSRLYCGKWLESCWTVFSSKFPVLTFVRSPIVSNSSLSSPPPLTLEWWDAVLQKRLDWALFVLFINPLVLSATRVDLGFFVSQSVQFYSPPPLFYHNFSLSDPSRPFLGKVTKRFSTCWKKWVVPFIEFFLHISPELIL